MAGIAVLTPALTFLIARLGWQDTLLAFAVLFADLTVPLAWWVIRDHAPEGADGPLPLRRSGWWRAVCSPAASA